MLQNIGDIARKFLLGGFMGLAGLVPGVSSGTVAVMAGIYADIIHAVGGIFHRKEKKLRHLLFLVNVFSGMVLATLFFARFIDHLLTIYPGEMKMLFIGLIIGTTPSLYRKATGNAFKPVYLVPLTVSFILVVALGLARPEATDPITTLTLANAAMLFFAGFLSSGAGLVPGISGSMVLLLIGMYSTMIVNIKEFNFPPLVILALGALVGLVVFSRSIHYLMQRHQRITYSAIIGLFVGSAVSIWPGLPDGILGYLVHGLILVIGAMLAFLSIRLGKEKNG
ncbi:MAG: DUF368 domain-containing protein [Clostridia bacterium]